MNNKIIKQIKQIEFGILSAEDIKKLSVCEIITAKIGEKGSVYDLRLGPMDNNQKCATCGCNNKDCPGHFSYIELNMKLINPLYNLVALLFLKCFCFNCSSMLQSKEHLNLKGLYKIKQENKFKMASEILQKILVCPVCKEIQPLFYENKPDKNIYMCETRAKPKAMQTKKIVEIEDIARVFNNISSDDIQLIGINPRLCHPKHIIMSRLFVLPPRSRPYVVNEGQTCDDDLTTKYCIYSFVFDTELSMNMYETNVKDVFDGKIISHYNNEIIVKPFNNCYNINNIDVIIELDYLSFILRRFSSRRKIK